MNLSATYVIRKLLKCRFQWPKGFWTHCDKIKTKIRAKVLKVVMFNDVWLWRLWWLWCGSDQIPARVLKESASELASILASLFQQSFDNGTLLSAWKEANITAIFKKRHSADPKNYRPVSLTSLIAKTMEHIICKQIRSHLSRNSIISQHQHGFQRGLSCHTQLITVIHEWASTLNIHGQVFLDFAKAFDTVPHERLTKGQILRYFWEGK